MGEVGEKFDYGLNLASKPFDGKNKYLRITDIDENTHKFNYSDIVSPLSNTELDHNYLLDKNDLVFARTGASVGKTYLYNEEDGIVYFAGYLIRVSVKNQYYPHFIFYKTITNSYNNFVNITSMRSGQPGINSKEYKSFQFALPEYNEQEKIGKILCDLDSIITAEQEKISKLEQIFNLIRFLIYAQKNKSYPVIRFNDFEDEWYFNRLDKVLDYEQPTNYLVENTDYDDSYKIPVLTPGKTFFLGYTNEKEGIYDKGPVIIFDDFTTDSKYVNFPFKLKSSASKILTNKQNVNLNFIFHILKQINYNTDAHKRYWISEFSSFQVKYTDKDEQDRIAQFLDYLEKIIELSKVRKDKYIALKDYLLNKLFI